MVRKAARSNLEKAMLTIPPLRLKGKRIAVPLSHIVSDKLPSVSFDRAVVAYLDILGFSTKRDDDDIESCLMDFSGPLAIAAPEFSNVRFSVFGDCAFLAAPLEDAAQVIAAIRYAFAQWIADGILVRGGISLGPYRETQTATLALAVQSKNFSGHLFSGKGVTRAVRLEGRGNAALLFTNGATARFYAEKYGEPVFTLGRSRIIGWFDDFSNLYAFTSISFLRMLRLLDHGVPARDDRVHKLCNNIRYSFAVTSDVVIPASLIVSLARMTDASTIAKEEAFRLLNLTEPAESSPVNELLIVWSSKRDTELLRVLADFDSSIPGYTKTPAENRKTRRTSQTYTPP